MATLDPKDVFVQALRFHRSGQLLGFHAYQIWSQGKEATVTRAGSLSTATMPNHTFPPTLVVTFVCEAFSVELLLKTIWVLERMVVKKIHELDRLYDALPQRIDGGRPKRGFAQTVSPASWRRCGDTCSGRPDRTGWQCCRAAGQW